ncbi:MAG: alpha/beta fold hydrolase [Gammaproteobacteria bacterium]|nr:alpha/beta fold hydrolase [Gammaproteobacteria bacterium]
MLPCNIPEEKEEKQDHLVKHKNTTWTGILKHTFLWFTSSIQKVVYINPKCRRDSSLTIYCIHGTGDRPGVLSLLADRLISDDLPGNISKIHLMSFDNRAQGESIESFTDQLAAKIQTRNDKNVILIGHSRGGLIATYFAENCAKKMNITVHSVIAICTPFGGTDKAAPPWTWFSKSIAEMEKNSEFLNTLSAKVRQSTMPYRYFSAGNDEVVKGNSVCIPEHRDHLIELDGHNHASILTSNRLASHIRDYLKSLTPRLELVESQTIDHNGTNPDSRLNIR